MKRAILFIVTFCAYIPLLSQETREYNYCPGATIVDITENYTGWDCLNSRNTYRWLYSEDGTNWSQFTNWSQAPCSNTFTCTPSSVAGTRYYKLRCEPRGTVLETGVVHKVTIYEPFSAPVAGSSQTICHNTAPATISATAASGGNGSFTYQWQSRTDNTQWTDMQGINQLSVSPSYLTTTTYYRLRARSGSGCADLYSNMVTITVYGQLSSGGVTGTQSTCYGDDAAPLIGSTASGGDGTFSYEWQYSFDNTGWGSTGITTISYSPKKLERTTFYRLMSTNTTCGQVSSATVTVQVYPQLEGGTIGQAQTICYNTSPNNIVGSEAKGGYGLYSYQWQYSLDNNNFYPLPNSNTRDYHPTMLTSSTWYRRKVSDNCGTAYSNTVFITVHGELKGTTVSGDQSICRGANVGTLTGESPTGGDGSYTYRWQKSTDNFSFGDVVNSNTRDFQPYNITETTYFRRVTQTGICGSATSNTIKVAIKPGVAPGAIGSDQTICHNTRPLAIANASSPAGTYTTKWQMFANSTWSDVPGVTELSYWPGELSSTTRYRRVVTDECGPANSNEVTVTVLPKVSPGTVASDQTVCYRGTANSMVGGLPSGAEGQFTYLWQWSLDRVNWNDISGTNMMNYPPGTLEKTTHYRRMDISDKCGETPSNVVTISVHPELKNVNVAGDQIICPGAVINTLTGETPTGGDGNYSYKWQKLADGSGWGDIVNSNTKDFQPMGLTQTTSYRRITYTGSCGNATSNTVTVTVRTGVTAGSIGSDQTICYSTKPSSIVNTVTPAGTYTTKWYSFTNNSWSEIQGISDLSYSPGQLTTSTKYRRTVTDVCGSANSNEVTVTVLPQANPGTIAADQTVCYKSVPNALNGNGATGAEGSFTYRWQISGDKVTWGDIANSNTNGYLPGSLDKTTHYRRMAISDKCGEAPSNTVTVIVHPELKNTNIAGDQVICPGGTINGLTGETPMGGDGNNTYKWQKSTDGTPWGDIVNSNAKDFQPAGLSQTTYFKRVTMSANCGSATSNMVTVTVIPELVPGTISSAQVICEGVRPLELTGTAAAGQPDFSYQWQSSSSGDNYENIAGANNQNFWPGMMGNSKYFRRQVNGLCAPKYSNAIFVSVLPKPDVPSIQVKSSYCKGEAITLTGSGQFGHEWYDQNGLLLRTGNTYLVPGLENDLRLIVKALNQNNCRSAAQTIDLNLDRVKAGFTASTFLVNKGEFVQFTSGATNANSHKWDFSEGEGSARTNPVKYFYSAGAKDVKLTVTSGAGCRDSLVMKNYITVSSPTGTGSLTMGSFALYPSLAQDQVTIETGRTSSFEVYIINWEGKVTLVKKALNLNALSISVEHLPQGAYLVKIVQGRETATFKFTKL